MRYKHLLTEQQLDELRMSPSALRQFAQSPEAEGIKAGFEAELIFPGLGDSDGGDSEPDYDADERAYSIEDIINFFEYDDYGYGLSGREADRLRNDLDEQWMEYFDEAMYEEWHGEALSLIKDVIENTDWDRDEQIREYLSVEHPDLDADEIIKKAQEATSTRETPPEYLEAAEAVAQALDERAEESLANQDQYYDEALDEFRDNFSGVSEEDWLRENYRYMSDVADAFGLTWPYVRYEGGEGEFNEYAADQLASELSGVVGMRVIASSGYHSTKRSENRWIIEPDSSLEGNDSDDMPAEIVSPPMPLNQCLEMMDKFFAWAKENRAYSNYSTGFHMGVSLPHTGGKVDFIKLALFLGDEHVLEEFGRSSNHFTEAAMKKIKHKVKQNAGGEQIGNAMTLLRNGLIELATKAMSTVAGHEKNPGFGKYTSINPKDNYIEFRSAGGEDYSDDVEKLKNTLLRYAQAMTVAANPAAERKEYYKKLYKLISPAKGDASIDLFARFASGNISKEELKAQWAEAALEKDAPEILKKGNWTVFDKTTGKPVKGRVQGVGLNGITYDEAMQRAKAEISPGSSMEGFKKQYDLINNLENTGEWAVVDRETDEIIGVIAAATRGEAGDQAAEGYGNRDYYIRPYVEFDKQSKPLSRRAELAKRIKSPKAKEPEKIDVNKLPKYYIMDTTNDQIVHLFSANDIEEARQYLYQWQKNHSDPDGNKYKFGPTIQLNNQQKQQGIEAMQSPQTAQARELPEPGLPPLQPGERPRWRLTNLRTGDSSIFRADDRASANQQAQQMARRVGADYNDFDVTPIDPIGQQSTQQAHADNGLPMWEIYQRRNDLALHRFADHTQMTAWSTAGEWARNNGFNPSDLSLRPATTTQPVGAQAQQTTQQVQQQPNVTDNWEIVDPTTGQVVRRLTGTTFTGASHVADTESQLQNRNNTNQFVVRRATQPTTENLKLTKTVLEDLDSWLSDMKLPKGFSK